MLCGFSSDSVQFWTSLCPAGGHSLLITFVENIPRSLNSFSPKLRDSLPLALLVCFKILLGPFSFLCKCYFILVIFPFFGINSHPIYHDITEGFTSQRFHGLSLILSQLTQQNLYLLFSSHVLLFLSNSFKDSFVSHLRFLLISHIIVTSPNAHKYFLRSSEYFFCSHLFSVLD
jgi:hypothetical protein